jgi:hypothetical protein
MDVATLTAAYESRARTLLGIEVLPPAVRLSGRLAPEQWTLELYLPEWLGAAFGLDATTRDALSVANVLGLVAVRLRDDASDDELDATLTGYSQSTELAGKLLDAALEPYRARLSPDSPFWPALERWLADPTPGAPLKVPAYAICLLADRLDAWPRLDECLDHALRALVLYDHAADWPADLAAGRTNHFADHLGSRSAAEVRVALMAGSEAGAYFDRIESELTAAADLADRLVVGALAGHLRALAVRLHSDGLALEAHYSSLGDRAAVLFG